MWDYFIKQEKKKLYFKKILSFLKKELEKGKIIYPSFQNIFRAFKLTNFDNTKVVILGQDPYPGPNQAHGLSFSTLNEKTPSSLKNIFKELKNDLSFCSAKTNNLTLWALEGVLLINSILTVEKNKPLSHQHIGWHNFTINFFNFLNYNKKKVVYILWGKFAQNYEKYIIKESNFIIKSSHPSFYSAHKGFLGSRPFSKTNNYLQENNIKTINWNLDR
ncbi:uracil-DNA glycosylase ['Cynodon dactylon' phytoplasma]|uniref:uracil-DNA glycosylase n=1 Tax='Cynodon dactylon' phytoplasma TaxID=295320 RepID=UPI001265D160|nr:uracil-DNA glycosylase ['Cynodon dactylon' phytoplasma]KAB8121751.1 uracil-DNA glycosylase ['Cynodon dactylon' phytoplasma]